MTIEEHIPVSKNDALVGHDMIPVKKHNVRIDQNIETCHAIHAVQQMYKLL